MDRSCSQPKSAELSLRSRLVLMYSLLILLNVCVWGLAQAHFSDQPVMMGMALLAYGLGMRHAVDADHIAAIDNVTRKLIQEGKRPITVGLWFAAGHSTVVVVASIVIAAVAGAASRIEGVRQIGGLVATSVSAVFLLAIAAMNLLILRSVWRTYRSIRAGLPYRPEDLDSALAGGGFFTRLLRPLFGLVRESWHMAPLGFVFGLGFETATEVAILGLSATHSASGISLGGVLIFPALFAAGMMLIDATDGVLMLGAYEWAFLDPVRKLYYNISITFISAMVAVLIGLIQGTSLIADEFGLDGPPWSLAVAAAERLNAVGFAIIGVFLLSWLISMLIFRKKSFRNIDLEAVRT